MFSDINVKMVKAPQCSERRMGGCLAVPGPEVGRCVRAGVRLLSSLSWGHIPSVATRHTPGLYRRLSSCTWQHNPLINLEGPPLVHTLLKHLLLILSILSLSSIPMNQKALFGWAIFWRPCIFSYQLLTLQCIGFDNLAGMVSNNVYNSKQ